MTWLSLSLRRWLGAVVWVGGVGLALVGGASRASSTEAPGIGFAPPVQVAPLEAGRLDAVSVTLHAAVRAGDVVATIDESVVRAEREMASATLLATQERLGFDLAAEARRYAESAEGSALTRAQLSALIEEDLATLDALEQRRQIEAGLAAHGASAGLVADEVAWEIAVVRSRLAANRAALEVARQAADAAERRNTEAPGLEAWESVAAARAVEWVDRRLEQYTLRAGIDGHVTAIHVAPGTLVAAGAPVLEVRALQTAQIVAYVPTADVGGVERGDEVVVVRGSGASLAGRVASIGGSPQALPLPLWPYPNYPQYAVPVRVELVGGSVAPDESVTVRL